MKKILPVFVTSVLVATAGSAFSGVSVQIQLQLNSNSGSTQTLDLKAWNWGVIHNREIQVPAIAGNAVENSTNDLAITKYLDDTSALLEKHNKQGTHFDNAIITVYDTDAEPEEYYLIVMKDVSVAGISAKAAIEENCDCEKVFFTYSNMDITHYPQAADALPVQYGFAATK